MRQIKGKLRASAFPALMAKAERGNNIGKITPGFCYLPDHTLMIGNLSGISRYSS